MMIASACNHEIVKTTIAEAHQHSEILVISFKFIFLQTYEPSFCIEINSANSMESLDLHFSDSGFSTISSIEGNQSSSLSKSHGKAESTSPDNLTKQKEPRDLKRKRWLKTAEVTFHVLCCYNYA